MYQRHCVNFLNQILKKMFKNMYQRHCVRKQQHNFLNLYSNILWRTPPTVRHRIQHFCGARSQRCATESCLSVAHPSRGAPQNSFAPTYMWVRQRCLFIVPNFPKFARAQLPVALDAAATPRRWRPRSPAPRPPPPEPRRRPPRGRARPRRRPSRAPASPYPSPSLPSTTPPSPPLPSPSSRPGPGTSHRRPQLAILAEVLPLSPFPLLPWLHTRCLMKCATKFSRFQLLVLSVFAKCCC